MPLLAKGILAEFGIKEFSRGKLFSAGSNSKVTVIHTGMGPAFTGDAVLYLKDSGCLNVILFGSCGLVQDREGLCVGKLVCPSESYANESFTDLLLSRRIRKKPFGADKGLLKALLHAGKEAQVEEVTAATMASLKLEEDMRGSLIKEKIDVVDMESSAFFAAAHHAGLRAAALFYVSDSIGTIPFYALCGQEDYIRAAIRKSVAVLKKCIEESLA